MFKTRMCPDTCYACQMEIGGYPMGSGENLNQRGNRIMSRENRSRQIRKEINLTEQEYRYIKSKMEKAGVKTFQNYARKMLMLGSVVTIDFSELIGVKQEINRIGVNINQIAKYVNVSEEVTQEELQALKNSLSEINDLITSKMKETRKAESQFKDKDKEKIEPWL
ncbi:plasmid mobilization protein [Streptococcus suis]|nr:plasmid mobilization relaxosome protein MobC [Streptococcus suis]